jgi:chorismate mutase-like protein
MAENPPAANPALLSLRTQIDAVDRELLTLLNRRAALALEVGEVKKKEGSVAFRPEREAQVIDGLKAQNPGPLESDSVAPIWREIMSACRALETPTRVAYLGPAGTFSELAALGFFGSSIVKVSCASIDEVFRSTSAGAADFGVVPVENSTEGVVARSLDLFLTEPLFIIGETSLFVRHNLLRRDNSLFAPIRRRSRSVMRGSAITCRVSSGGRLQATPKGRASQAWTRRSPASPASARAASTACMSWRRRSRTTCTTARVLRSSRIRNAIRSRKRRAMTAPASSCR